MSKINFLSAALLGAVVTINGTSTQEWGGIQATPGTSVTIEFERSNYYAAPEGFNFYTSVSGFDTASETDLAIYDPSFHDKVYFWDHGDDYDFTAPQHIPSQFMKSRDAMGPISVHTYRSAGNYRPRCIVYEKSSGKIGVGYLNIGGASEDTPAVADPDVVFAGANTVYVDPDAVYSGAPSGAQESTSLNSAYNLVAASENLMRIVLSAGKTHEVTSEIGWRPSSATRGRVFRIESDPSNPATVEPSASFPDNQVMIRDQSNRDNMANRESCLFGVRFIGPWDSTTETGKAIYMINHTIYSCQYGLVEQCHFSGWAIAVNSQLSGGVNPGNLVNYVVTDTVVTNWQNFGFYGLDYTIFGFAGSRIMQDVDALSGGNKYIVGYTAFYNNHGPYRIPYVYMGCFLSCDLFNRVGWSGQGSIDAIQPCARINSSCNAGARFNMWGCVLEGGYVVFHAFPANNNLTINVVNYVLEANFFLMDFETTVPIETAYGGWSIRNNFAVVPNVQKDISVYGEVWGGHFGEFVRVRGDQLNTYTSECMAAPIIVENNTIINLLADVNDSPAGGTIVAVAQNGSNTFTAITDRNNIIHEPNRTVPNTPAAPLSSAQLFTPRMKAYVKTSARFVFASTTVLDGGMIMVDLTTAFGGSNISAVADIDVASGKTHVEAGGTFHLVDVISVVGDTLTVQNNTGATISNATALTVPLANHITLTGSETPAGSAHLWELAAGSPGIGGGVTDGPLYDFNGDDRSSPHDLGAILYAS